MATQFDPIAKDQSINTTESPSRNIADVLAQELSGIATALTTASNTKLHLYSKLWENPSPSSAFSAQTITLASSDYDFLCIFYRSDDIYNSTTIPKGHSATLNDSFAISSNLVARVRYLNRSSDTAYAVTDCTRVSYGSSTTQNDTVIPIAIYGFKKSVDINAIVSSVSTDADKCIMSDGVTSVEQAIGELQKPTFSVMVTADGVKTYEQLLNELYGLINFDKINVKSVLKHNGVIYQVVRASSTYARFTCTDVTTSDIQNETMRIQSTSSRYFISKITTSPTVTITNLSSTVATSGVKIELFY